MARRPRACRSLNLRGIYFQKELKRFYPKRGLAAQVLGYVGMEDTGLAGIEHEYQNQLNGVKGRVVITMDARRKWFGHVEQPPEPGSNVVLTIDEKIQFIAEKELAAGDGGHEGSGRHGGGAEPAHRRDSGAGQCAFVQSQPARARLRRRS